MSELEFIEEGAVDPNIGGGVEPSPVQPIPEPTPDVPIGEGAVPTEPCPPCPPHVPIGEGAVPSDVTPHVPIGEGAVPDDCGCYPVPPIPEPPICQEPTHPYRMGDTVYHPFLGEGSVIGVKMETVKVAFSSGIIRDVPVSELSFTPWGHGSTKRPLKEGWYALKINDERPFFGYRDENGKYKHLDGFDLDEAMLTTLAYIGLTL